jgi:HSP20 family molecular chaperone IbpA
MENAAQKVPVRISRSDSRLLLISPIPGIKPADISITISGRFVKISAKQTGPGQDDKDIIVDEWKIGPYYREVELPENVDGALTNATLGNGVLTLAMPKTQRESESVSFQLEATDAGKGERIGHKGLEPKPSYE